MDLKRGFASWWIIIIFVIIVIGFLVGVFWKGTLNTMTNSNDESNEPVKDNVALQDSTVEELNDDSVINGSIKSSVPSGSGAIPTGGGGGGGGGGSSTESTTINNETIPATNDTLPPEDVATFSNLEELFSSNNPVGNNVNLHGMAIPISGISTSDYFFFTDDIKVLNDINYILFNKPDHQTTIYNSVHVLIPQSIIDLTGTVVRCRQNDDGIYCVDAITIG